MKKKIVLILVVLGVVIQAIRIDKTNPVIQRENEYLTLTKAPADVCEILQRACYDCHSNETKYPWYSNIAPVSWMLRHHVVEGREEVNFSEWGIYFLEARSKIHKKCLEEIKEDEMPISSYTLLHENAKLSQEDKTVLVKWFELQCRGE